MSMMPQILVLITCCGVSKSYSSNHTEPLFNAALLAGREYMEAENTQLRTECPSKNIQFSIEHIKLDDYLIQFYTGFITYRVF